VIHEQPLSGGNASGAVVRVGETVRKPWTTSTPSVVAFVDHLRLAGVDAPAPLGRDDAGRQVQEFVAGTPAIDLLPLSESDLRRVGAMVRAIHDASATCRAPDDAVWETAIPAPGDEILCHNDLAPWNLLVGDRWLFIDWDAAAPSTRAWDLAYAAQSFTLFAADRDPNRAAVDLAALVGGYRADDDLRKVLPDSMAARTAAMVDLLRTSHVDGVEPWASMFRDGHGEYWSAVDTYVRSNRDVWRAALTTE
jgi:Ser/Thr protein kinase RdoA (MazF antagonist)